MNAPVGPAGPARIGACASTTRSRVRSRRSSRSTAGRVKIYSCGPTVYRYVHIGNMRSFMLADLIRRALRFEGLRGPEVHEHHRCRSHDRRVIVPGRDKMLLAVEDEGLQPPRSRRSTRRRLPRRHADRSGSAPRPHAAGDGPHPRDDLDLIETLIEKGHAYEVETGSVYYDVTTFPGYGKLSGNTLDKLKAGHRDLETDPAKRHPDDFALWKSAGPGRLLKWPSPWGEGFPGWHIECSAMSMKYLGDRFDVHTGGNDLKFPHHEDEIAQSEGAVGHQVVSIWVHGGFLRIAGQKIAKSTDEHDPAPELAEHGLDPLAFRWLTFQTRYRSEMDFTWEVMETADQRVRQLRRHVAEWGEPADDLGRGCEGVRRSVPRSARERPRHAFRRQGRERPRSLGEVPPAEKRALLASWDHVLGLDLEREARAAGSRPRRSEQLVAERDAARASKDYPRSDELRDELQAMDLEVMDTRGGDEGPSSGLAAAQPTPRGFAEAHGGRLERVGEERAALGAPAAPPASAPSP